MSSEIDRNQLYDKVDSFSEEHFGHYEASDELRHFLQEYAEFMMAMSSGKIDWKHRALDEIADLIMSLRSMARKLGGDPDRIVEQKIDFNIAHRTWKEDPRTGLVQGTDYDP